MYSLGFIGQLFLVMALKPLVSGLA